MGLLKTEILFTCTLNPTFEIIVCKSMSNHKGACFLLFINNSLFVFSPEDFYFIVHVSKESAKTTCHYVARLTF